MGDMVNKQIEKFEADYNKLASKDGWTKDDIAMMKDLKKLIYYSKVICAMDEGDEYPGSEYIDGEYLKKNSYAGRPTPRMNRNGGSGHYPMGNGPWYYDSNMSGRRYYDNDRMSAIERMRRMMENEQNPDVRMAIQNAIRDLEQQ